MRATRRPGIVLLLAAALAGCTAPLQRIGGTSPPAGGSVADSTTFTTGDYRGCPPEGDGGDPDLNRLKNRDLPPPAYEPLTLKEILERDTAPALDAGSLHRARWSDEAREAVAEWENRGASVEGVLLKVKQEGPESCNCHTQEDRDYHVWLAEDAGADRGRSMVTEVSPRVRPSHESWRLRILSRLAKDKARVRISGWLMWDQEHPDQLGKSRGTLWEIHPIHKIEVYSGGRWREL